MSDMRTGWHFLEWERYRLGWLTPPQVEIIRETADTVVYPANPDLDGREPKPEATTLLLIPARDGRVGYAVEVGKGLGRTAGQRDAWKSYDLVGNGEGVLVFLCRSDVPRSP